VSCNEEMHRAAQVVCIKLGTNGVLGLFVCPCGQITVGAPLSECSVSDVARLAGMARWAIDDLVARIAGAAGVSLEDVRAEVERWQRETPSLIGNSDTHRL